MRDIKTHIKNPLSIIAIFAGLIEICGTAILPLLSPESQSVYLWFLIIFPCLLLVFFFATLNFNHKVLYAPSDFVDESNFMHLFKEKGFIEKEKDIHAEIEQIIKESEEGQTNDEKRKITPLDIHARYLLAEQMVFSIIESRYGSSVLKHPILEPQKESMRAIDGLIEFTNELIGIEIKFVSLKTNIQRRLKEAIWQIQEFFNNLPDKIKQNHSIKAIIAIVTETKSEQENIQKMIGNFKNNDTNFDVEIEFFSIEENADPNKRV